MLRAAVLGFKPYSTLNWLFQVENGQKQLITVEVIHKFIVLAITAKGELIVILILVQFLVRIYPFGTQNRSYDVYIRLGDKRDL